MIQSSTAFVGLDVRKESIEVAIADAREARYFGRIGGDARSVDKLTRRVHSVRGDLTFVTLFNPSSYRRL